jgi:hypothetical protein
MAFVISCDEFSLVCWRVLTGIVEEMKVVALFICVLAKTSLSFTVFPNFSTTNDLQSAVSFITNDVCPSHSAQINIIVLPSHQISFRTDDLISKIFFSRDMKCSARISSKLTTSTRFRGFNVILLDDFESFLAFDDYLLSSVFVFNDPYLFVFIQSVGKLQMDEIFGVLWSKYIHNVNILVEIEGQISIFTFLPFSDDLKCGDSSSQLLSKFVNGSFDKPVYPEKFNNLRNCSIKVVTYEDNLAVFKMWKHNGGFELIGFDIEFLKALSQSLHFHSDVNFLDGNDTWGMVLANGTVTGGLGELVKRNAEIGIGNYFLKANRLKVLDSSSVYYTFPLVFVIPPGAPLSPFRKLLQPFNAIVWFLLLLTLLVGVVSILLINRRNKTIRDFVYGSNVRNPLTNMLLVALGSSQPKLPRRNFSRFLLMMFSMFCLVQRSIYQGSLYIFLQSDTHEKEVQTFAELLEKDFDFYLFDSHADIFEDHPKITKRYGHD